MAKHVEPSTHETAFSCPHCGAYTTQYWYKLFAKGISGERPVPFIPTETQKAKLQSNREIPEDEKKFLLSWMNKMLTGLVFFEKVDSEYCQNVLSNLNVSKCYNCDKIAVWIHHSLLFPHHKASIQPNPYLPDHIVHDFEEAREIVDSSPRGAAALLRLCVQKLCQHLGAKGKNIDDDIASLVKKGLNPLVQQSLDVVRVIGNEAVHPGTLDLKDDKETAIRLFELVNSITEQLISQPKSIREMYEKLPETKRKAIESRDQKVIKEQQTEQDN